MDDDGRDTTNDFVKRYERGIKTFTIFFDPLDYPGKFVVRGFTSHMDSVVPDKECELADTLEKAREKVPPGLVRLDRHPLDDAKIVEVWV